MLGVLTGVVRSALSGSTAGKSSTLTSERMFKFKCLEIHITNLNPSHDTRLIYLGQKLDEMVEALDTFGISNASIEIILPAEWKDRVRIDIQRAPTTLLDYKGASPAIEVTMRWCITNGDNYIINWSTN